MLKNIFILVNGTALAQIILLLAVPVLSRQYTPAEFGVYGIFIAILTVLMPFSTLKYATAILIKTEKISNSSILVLCFGITFGISFLTYLLCLAGSLYFSPAINGSLIKIFPLLFFAAGVSETLVTWHVFHGRFIVVSIGKAIQAATTVLVQIAFFSLYKGDGLIYGYAFGTFSMFVFYFLIFVLKDHASISYRKAASGVKNAAVHHRDFPLYSLWANLLNSLSNQLPIIFLSKFFSASVTGNFEMSRRLTRAPLALVGQSIFRVVSQRVGLLADSKLEAGEILKSVTTYMANLAIIPFVFGVLFLDDIFLVVLGEQWAEAGFYAQILSPWMFMIYLAWPLTSAYNTFGYQKQLVVFNMIFTLCIVVSFSTVILFDFIATYVLIVMAGLGTFSRILYCFWILGELAIAGIKLKLVQITTYCVAISVAAFAGANFI